MWLKLYILTTYIVYMCLVRYNIDQAQHIFVVTSFILLFIIVSYFENFVIHAQQYIDRLIRLEPTDSASTYSMTLALLECLHSVQDWVVRDYKRSKLQNIVRKVTNTTQRHIKYFLSYSKNNDEY
jgi:hypothetical protein